MTRIAFEAAVTRHQRQVFTYACYLLGNREEAEDVAQEVLIRLWRNRRLLGSERLGGWLLRVTRNACYDRLRLRKRSAHLFVVEDGAPAPSDPPTPGPGPEELAASAQLGRRLRAALDAVGEPFKSVIILREIQGMSYREIAEVLELPLSTVRVALHRGRRRLRERLGTEVEHACAS
jgi:RNA polymerase sigma factor (sigma-70 family)